MPVSPKDAATILIVRDGPGLEVLMVERHAGLDFGAGALVFPGGKLEASDGDPAWASHALGWSDLEPHARSLRVCAVREAFEETGVLFGYAGPAQDADLLRTGLCKAELSFRDVVKGLGVTLDLGQIVPFSRWITPESSPIRFDATFFIAHAPSDQVATCDGRETVSAEWLSAKAALALGRSGERRLMHPTRMTLEQLATDLSAADAISRAALRTIAPQQRH